MKKLTATGALFAFTGVWLRGRGVNARDRSKHRLLRGPPREGSDSFVRLRCSIIHRANESEIPDLPGSLIQRGNEAEEKTDRRGGGG